MSYKDEIKGKVEAIFKEGKPDFQKITEVLKTVYTKALYESKKTGQSIESITYEILEGVEEGAKLKPEKMQEVLKNAAEEITELIHESAHECISQSHKAANIAKSRLQDTIEAEKSHLLESIEAFKSYAKDKSHHLFATGLNQTEEKVSQWIHNITDKIEYSQQRFDAEI